MGKLGIGVIGVGTMGKQHARNIRCLIPEAKLIAVADTDLKRGQQRGFLDISGERYLELIKGRPVEQVRYVRPLVIVANHRAADRQSQRQATAAFKNLARLRRRCHEFLAAVFG